MPDTEFRLSNGGRVAAERLSIEDKVVDAHGVVRRLTWSKKLPKAKRLLVDIHRKALTVTASPRTATPGGQAVFTRNIRHGITQILQHNIEDKVVETHGVVQYEPRSFSEKQ